jgi:zinc protease
MRQHSRKLAAVAVLVLAAASTLAAQQKPATTYKNLKYPPLHNLQVPKPERVELPNGMVLFLLEDHELPTVTVAARIHTGNRLEPGNKTGLASVTGSVMRTGGTTTMSGDKLDDLLDHMGAEVETGIDESEGSASAFSLKENAPQVIHILADVLRNPAFPQDKIDLAKTEIIDGISRRNENKDAIAQRELRRILYGKDSPYGRLEEYDTVNAITRADLVAFHKMYYQPENVILGIWGDFKTADMKALIEKEFGSWPKGGHPIPPVPEVEPAAQSRSGIYVIDKPDVNQSTVIIAALGGKRNDPDYYAASVLTQVLGGGFSSRLFNRVRTKEGLAYGTGSSWGAGWDMPGDYMAYASTKSGSTVKALNVIKEEIHKIGESEVTDAELQQAKDYILNGIAFDFDSTGKIVTRLLQYEYFGYPPDFLQRYEDNVRKVTKPELLKVAKQYWDTSKMFVLIVGNTKEFDESLSSLGPVTKWDISIPKPKAEAVSAATPESLEKGKQLLAKTRQAMGGDKLAAVNDLVETGSMSLQLPQGALTLNVESTQTSGGKSLQKMTTPMGEMMQGYDGKVMWAKTPQGVREAPAEETDQAKEEGFRETVFLLARAGSYEAQALGTVALGDKQVEAVVVTDPQTKQTVKLLIDPTTGLLMGKEYTGSMMGAPGEIQEQYLEFNDTAGIKVPSKVELFQNGQKKGEVIVSKVAVNTGVTDATFAKP